MALPPADVPLDRLVGLVDRLVRRDPGRHADLLHATLEIALTHGAPAALARLAPLITIEGLVGDSAASARDALYWLGRIDGPTLPPLESLLRAALAGHLGERARGLEALAHVPRTDDDELDQWHVGTGALLALRGPLDAARAYLAELAPWAERSAVHQGRWLGWMGLLAYREGDFIGAADLHQRAAASKSGAGEVASLINAAAALDDAFEFGEAGAIAARAEALARALRHPTFEAMALSVGRSAAYRAGAARLPGPDGPVEAAGLGPMDQLRFAIIDASHAFRRGRRAAAIDLALRLAEVARRLGASTHRALLLATAAAAGAALDPQAISSCVDFAEACGVAELAVQVYGLLCMADPRPEWQARIEALAAQSRAPADVRLEVLSLRECRAGRLDG